MRSALYYPHTKLHTENILKRSLLLWDKLEYIVAHKSYMPTYEDKRFARALELFGVPRHPTHEEKRKTHESIMDVFTRPNLPRSFYSHEGSSYPIYPDKFLPDTWDMLEELGVTTAQREASGREPLPEPAGLLLMSLLADTCAGETRARVTDRAAAYANITNLLTIDRDSVPRETISEDLVVPMTLDLINISDITLDELISFREREEKSGGGTLADLRHNYVDSIENYVSSLRQHSLSQADREELRRQFQSKMQDDLRDLCQELKLARTKVVFSSSVVTVIVIAGIAAAHVLGVSLDFPAAITSTAGGAMVVGGVLSQGLDYATSRKTLMQKHPMAYMYELQNFTP